MLAAVVVTVCSMPPPASATDASKEQLRDLARRAAADASALAELRNVDSVEGESMPVGASLEGADGDELAQRLRAFDSGAGDAAPPDASSVRSEAREIVARDEFQPRRLPDPIRRAFEWVGEKLEPVGRLFNRLASHLPGRQATLWVIIAGAVLLFALVVAGRLAARRGPVARRRDAGHPVPGGARPHRLESAAAEAEASGDLERAIRLRFRAGLLRLDEANLIEFRPSITSREIRASLRSETFERLAAMFDEVVYGRRDPDPSDATAARDAWDVVLREAVAR